MHCLGAGVGTQANGSPAIPSNSSSSSSGGNGVGTGTSENSSSSSSSNADVSPTSSNSVVPGSGSGSGSGSSSSESVILGVVRALGILVCEGRIQGLPRGYKEGPHCVPPLAPSSTNHQCEKDNYLCDRYLVLVREITDRVEIGSYLCVEVVLCSDCPCGLLKSKCKKRIVSNVPPTTPWQHTSEMLLEYWCIGIVQSKNPETMMNSQGLYQAVRSRLHFSQVAAWWSRTQGARPSYIATRLVPHNSLGSDEHLKRFSETPVEHNFPLANLGDGHYVQVTMWALPRMEDIPCLQCPLHHHQQQEEPKTIVDGCPRASTPSKHLIPTSNNDTTSVATTIPDLVNLDAQTNNLQMPALLDDRLRIDCDQLGKHHCQCADDEEDVHEIPTSPAAAAAAAALVRPNGERKRRRSLPCRPPEPTAAAAPCSESNSPVLPKLQESVPSPSGNGANAPLESSSSIEGLERSFRTQLSIEDQQECHGNKEKRYKRSESTQQQQQQQPQQQQQLQQGPENNTNVPLLVPWLSYSANGHAQASSLPLNNDSSTKAGINLVINPFHSYQNFSMTGNKVRGRSAEPELSNSGFQQQQRHHDGKNKVNSKAGSIFDGDDLNRLMSKLSFTQDKESSAGSSKLDQSRLLEWIYRVPGCVLGKDGVNNNNNNNSSSINNNNNNDELVDVKTFTTTVAHMSGGSTTSTQTECDVKARNRHLKLSPKEFDEVIAVLKARTPMGRKRPGVRTAKRREKYDKLINEIQVQQLQTSDAELPANGREDESLCRNKADMFMGAILRSSSKETNTGRIGLADISNGTRTPVFSAKENAKAIEKALVTKITIPPKKNDLSLETDSRNKISFSDYEEPSLPSAINKRLLRIKQIFKREQEKTTPLEKSNNVERFITRHESRAKRRIDFTSISCGNDKKDNETNVSCCNSLAGTSQNRVIADTTSHSTNCEIKDSCYPSKQEKKQQHRAACFDEKLKRKNKQRGKRDLSPIWVNQKIHNNDTVENNELGGCAASELDNNDKSIVPSAKDQERFRRSLENAASMVFHSRTGLPLTSSPAPLRRGHCCFDFDSSLNSVSSKRSALFELNTPPSPGAVSLEEADREIENVCDIEEVTRRRSNSRNRPQSHSLLGSFEESALNGRLEPVSTVHGFTAEIGASGAFCPKHRKLPVTVFFYTLGDNDKVSSPYLAHINLGKKGYQVPRSGTIQVTLLNPLGTVVKMFVVLYDLTDMPIKSHTFLRQRTLRDKTLRYLIHLRFMSGKSGRIYLHTDVRMIICRKADVDTASDFGSEPPKELRSYIHGPTNPKFSPRC